MLLDANLLDGMQTLCKHSEMLGLPECQVSLENEAHLKLVSEVEEESKITAQLVEPLLALWADPGIQKTFQHGQRGEFVLIDNLEYFMKILIAENSFPRAEITLEDALHARCRTSGIQTIECEVEGIPFKVIDVGGIRNERKKWKQCFENCSGVVFCVSLGHFNVRIFEDRNTMYLDESLHLLAEIAANEMLKPADIFVVFVSEDLMREKLTRFEVQFTDVCPEFKGDNIAEDVIPFIQNMYRSVLRSHRLADLFVVNPMDLNDVVKMMTRIQKALGRFGDHVYVDNDNSGFGNHLHIVIDHDNDVPNEIG
eukprot:TRINITY_DN4437_c0_g1_i3.p1 TRINITY_DN4437_c0_g1~~TRINITY_DN4437_c0_g1_i3.p1  ORF type:complete len:311 (-),score=67.33 TRINITY_DN4437_c0_g1_i3:13-945(-)